ncbi:MAG: hypothetical protein EBE86_007505 [Hormoscilla sp. GUM202]|nr:hypothetical protein [Hormoscilla sp. GUM202]
MCSTLNQHIINGALCAVKIDKYIKLNKSSNQALVVAGRAGQLAIAQGTKPSEGAGSQDLFSTGWLSQNL